MKLPIIILQKSRIEPVTDPVPRRSFRQWVRWKRRRCWICGTKTGPSFSLMIQDEGYPDTWLCSPGQPCGGPTLTRDEQIDLIEAVEDRG